MAASGARSPPVLDWRSTRDSLTAAIVVFTVWATMIGAAALSSAAAWVRAFSRGSAGPSYPLTRATARCGSRRRMASSTASASVPPRAATGAGEPLASNFCVHCVNQAACKTPRRTSGDGSRAQAQRSALV